MIFDLNAICKEFEKAKDLKDFQEYINEIAENNKILNEQTLDAQKTRKRISDLSTKYKAELNTLANYYGNYRNVINSPIQKSCNDLYNDLRYINDHIPHDNYIT